MQDLRFSSQDRMNTSANDYYETRFDRMRKSKMFITAGIAFAFVIFASIVIYAYNQGKTSSTLTMSGDVPLVKASAEAFKVRPTDEQGMEIAYQESTAYDQIEGTTTADDVENLLPMPEAAMDKPAVEMNEAELTAQSQKIIARVKTEGVDTTVAALEDMSSKMADITPAAGNTVTEPTTTATTAATTTAAPATRTAIVAEETAPSPAVTEEIKVASVQTPTETTKKAEATKTAAATTAPVSGNYRVQLASFKDKAAAEAAWGAMQSKYAPYLDNATKGITSADLGAKGTYYRLNAVNLSKDAATTLCNSIKTISAQGCLVAK